MKFRHGGAHSWQRANVLQDLPTFGMGSCNRLVRLALGQANCRQIVTQSVPEITIPAEDLVEIKSSTEP